MEFSNLYDIQPSVGPKMRYLANSKLLFYLKKQQQQKVHTTIQKF